MVRDKYDELRDIELYTNGALDSRAGFLSNRVKSVIPSIDIYYSKIISKNHKIDANLTSSFSKNDQDVYSEESGVGSFEDRMLLDSWKLSVIGELNYSTKIKAARLLLGYRASYSSADNTLYNNMTDGKAAKNEISFLNHYLYGELSGKIKSTLLYRVSLGVRSIRLSTDSYAHSEIVFTPILVLGYNINGNNAVRMTYRSLTKTPEIQQLSDNVVVVMDNFLKKGNPYLKNSINHELQVGYNYSNKLFSSDINVFYEVDDNNIFDDFREETINNRQYIVVSSVNAKKNHYMELVQIF